MTLYQEYRDLFEILIEGLAYLQKTVSVGSNLYCISDFLAAKKRSVMDFYRLLRKVAYIFKVVLQIIFIPSFC